MARRRGWSVGARFESETGHQLKVVTYPKPTRESGAAPPGRLGGPQVAAHHRRGQRRRRHTYRGPRLRHGAHQPVCRRIRSARVVGGGYTPLQGMTPQSFRRTVAAEIDEGATRRIGGGQPCHRESHHRCLTGRDGSWRGGGAERPEPRHRKHVLRVGCRRRNVLLMRLSGLDSSVGSTWIYKRL